MALAFKVVTVQWLQERVQSVLFIGKSPLLSWCRHVGGTQQNFIESNEYRFQKVHLTCELSGMSHDEWIIEGESETSEM